MLEDAAYRRLIDAYYTREAPLPVERRACYKLCRATSKDEREAVDYVLDEFFSHEDDGWHNERCDEEIAGYYAKIPAAEEKRENAKERQRKSRERRKAIFSELASHGINLSWNATTEQAQAELSRIKSQPVTGVVTQPVTRDNTATQTPDTRHQYVNPTVVERVVDSTVVERAPDGCEPVSPIAQVCIELKAMGYGDTNPHDFELNALLSSGMEPAEIIAVGEEFRGQGKRFRYVLKTAEGRRRDAASKPPLPDRAEPGQPRMTQHQRNQAAIAESLFGPQSRGPIQAPAEKLIEGEVIHERT